MLTNIKLSNFRIHKSTDINISNRFVALVVKNDVGKSSVLEALDILCNNGKQIEADDQTKDSTSQANIICTIDGRNLDYSSTSINEDRESIKVAFFKFGVDDNNHFIDLNQDLNSLISLWNNNCQGFIETTYPHHFERKKLEDLINIFIFLHQLYSVTTSQTIKDFIDSFMNGNRDLQKIISKKNILLSNCHNQAEHNIVDNLVNILSQFETDIQSVLQCNNLTEEAKKLIRQFKTSGNSNLIKQISEQVFVEDERNSELVQSLMGEPHYIAWISDESVEPVFDSAWYSFKEKIYNTFLNGGTQINDIPFFDEPENVDLGDLVSNGSLTEISSKADEILARFDQYANLEKENDIVFLWEQYLNGFGSSDINLVKRGSGFKRLCEIYAFTMQILGNFPINGGPIILTVEEPEISLHPSQQRDIVKRLNDILKLPNTQVIISTHSPFIVNELNENNIVILKQNASGNIITEHTAERCLKNGTYSTYESLAEINYLAFDESSKEYHIALYNFMQFKLNEGVAGLDNWIENNRPSGSHSLKTYNWHQVNTRTNTASATTTPHTLPYCLRNHIDHWHTDNSFFDDKSLVPQSIKIMRDEILAHKSLFGL